MLQNYNIKKGQKSLTDHLLEPDRFEQFSVASGELLLDFSRTSMDWQAKAQLLEVAAASDLDNARSCLFDGENVNFTEGRPALHMAMRSDEVLQQLDPETVARVSETRERMLGHATAFGAGHLPGKPEQAVRHILHIGIGGSVLGPRLLIEALGRQSCPEVHFLSSVDAHLRDTLLAVLNPAETAVVIASKSFSTGETLMHARRVLQWMQHELGHEAAAQRLFGVSQNQAAVEAFGIPNMNFFYLPEWVGGRYSIWSAVSLAATAVIGKDAFRQLLQGAAAMDRHFQQAPLAENLPVLMALTGIWHRNVCNFPSQAVVPYDYRLRSLPAYLQQLVMESNGKSVDSKGMPVGQWTSPVLFGEPGTDAQHSLFQMFHQGTDVVPLNFIGVIRPDHDDEESHAALLANLLAQATALATGTADEDIADPHRRMPGGRPSEIILLDQLTPRALGALLALFEHKVFVESVIWDINPFDQFGVELGKVLATAIEPALRDPATRTPANYGLDAILEHIHSRK